MEVWKEGKIKEFADVKGGKRLPKGRTLTSIMTNHPYIRIRDLGSQKILQLNSEYEYVDDETQKLISKYIVNTGDILVSVVGTIGLIGIVGKSLNNANQTENCDKITNLRNMDRDFLYYYLMSPIGQGEIKKGTVGAVQPKLPLRNIQELIVHYPSLEVQQKISSVLSSLDAKIEENKKINKNLFEQVMALYHHIFTENDVADRAICKANEYFDIAIGKTPPRKEHQWFSTEKGNVTWVSISDMGSSGLYISDSSEYLTPEAVAKFNVAVIPDNTVLLSFKLTVGRIAITEGEMTTN